MYKVDSLGSVYSYRKPYGPGRWIESETPKKLRPCIDKNGQPRVILMKDGKRKNMCVSYLVISTFLGDRPDGMFVCHNNGIPGDNRIGNLRYDTPLNNSADRKNHNTSFGAKGENHGIAKLNDQKVKLARLLFTQFGWGNKKICSLLGVSAGAMYAVLKNITWKHI